MDIQVASNFERALFEACDRDADWTAAAMNDFARERRLGLPQEVRAVLGSHYSAFACDDVATINAIRWMRDTPLNPSSIPTPLSALLRRVSWKMCLALW